MKLNKDLWYILDWKSLRKNKEENKGDPNNDFDGFIDTKSGETCIIEYTNIYTFENKNIRSQWERIKRGDSLSEGERDLRLVDEISWLDRNTIMKSVKQAHEKKNKKMYMNRSEKKVLVLEISGTFFNMFFMTNYMKDDLTVYHGDFLKDVEMELKNTDTKFDEIIFRCYPNQFKEYILSLATYQMRHDIMISLKNGFKRKASIEPYSGK